LKKALYPYNLLTILIGLLLFPHFVKAQDEFMVYGIIKIQGESTDSATIIIESDKRQYGRTITLDKTGEYRIWLPYSKDYILKFAKANYQTIPIAVSTKLPDDIAKCCFTPFEMSFHLFKTDGTHDSLFKKPIVTVRYETKLKSFYYSLDVDYYIQKMYIKAENEHKSKIKDQAFIARHKDSLEVERKYMSLVNSGNLYYSMHQFIMARQMFTKALEIKPNRRYPSYKLEDIETQLIIFNKAKDSIPKNADSIVNALLSNNSVSKKAIEYKRKTPEEIQAIFKQDLYKQIKSETKDPKELATRISFINNEVINKKETPPTIDSNKISIVKCDTLKSDTIIPIANIEFPKKDSSIQQKKPVDIIYIAPQPIDTIKVDTINTKIKIDTIKGTMVQINNTVTDTSIKITKPIQSKDSIIPLLKPKVTKQIAVKPILLNNRPFDKAAYQDSLIKRYPNERTIEIINEDYKKITKVIINRDNMVSIYLKVEHQWGGIFFFKDNTPFPLENISKSYFEVATKLLSDKENVKNLNKPQAKSQIKTKTKPNIKNNATKLPPK
jgi:tetratricopeptide (TPR) repeat protein